MGSGCGDPIVERVPSSVGQLPVPAALNAGSPTLFENTIQDIHGKVNINLCVFSVFYRYLRFNSRRSGFGRKTSDS